MAYISWGYMMGRLNPSERRVAKRRRRKGRRQEAKAEIALQLRLEAIDDQQQRDDDEARYQDWLLELEYGWNDPFDLDLDLFEVA